jgi:uncharacterized membrane protein
MTIVAQLATLLAPWQSLYSDSKIVSGSVTGLHIVALLFSGGLAIAADRTTLRALRGDDSARTRQLAELHAVHRPVLIALSVLVGSGVLLAAADVKTFLSAPLFWGKLVLVVVLLGNGAFLARTEKALQRDASPILWRRLRLAAWCSLVLWAITTLMGTALTSIA